MRGGGGGEMSYDYEKGFDAANSAVTDINTNVF